MSNLHLAGAVGVIILLGLVFWIGRKPDQARAVRDAIKTWWKNRKGASS